MKKIDLRTLLAHSYEERKKNVLYERPEFKLRIIQIEPGEIIPECRMDSQVIFLCLEGLVEVTVCGEKVELGEMQLLAAEPGHISMRGLVRSRLLGIQIKLFSSG